MLSYTIIKKKLLEKTVKILLFKSKIFITFLKETQHYYFWVTSHLFTKKVKSYLFLVSEGSNPSFYLKTIKNLILWSRKIEKNVVKRIILKGLGLKAFLVKDSSILQLKLGFSGLTTFLVPTKKIKLILYKRRILVIGRNLLEVNQFAFKIKSCKKPNIFKGKGLWYKNEKINLKPVRKA